MSWGFWSILAGLALLLATFFICMELLYAHVRQSAREGGQSVEPGNGQPSGASAKQAA